MRPDFCRELECPECAGDLALEVRAEDGGFVREGVLSCAGCARRYPVIASIPRLLPAGLDQDLLGQHPEFFARHPDLAPRDREGSHTARWTQERFGAEWRRYSELHDVHRRIFDWYFEGSPANWPGRRVLDAGCGMGRWMHFARAAGARVVGLDLSPAIDVVYAREGDGVDLVQADLTRPGLRAAGFDLVYCLGVIHHIDDPPAGARALARLVRPGGELRLYVYRSLAGDPFARRALLALVTALRVVTSRLPDPLLHAFCVAVAAVAEVTCLMPRRLLRGSPFGERLTRGLPLSQYVDVPFRMLVAEQYDRFGAPLERRYTAEETRALVAGAGVEIEALLPDLGWRLVARRR